MDDKVCGDYSERVPSLSLSSTNSELCLSYLSSCICARRWPRANQLTTRSTGWTGRCNIVHPSLSIEISRYSQNLYPLRLAHFSELSPCVAATKTATEQNLPPSNSPRARWHLSTLSSKQPKRERCRRATQLSQRSDQDATTRWLLHPTVGGACRGNGIFICPAFLLVATAARHVFAKQEQQTQHDDAAANGVRHVQAHQHV